MLLTRKCSLQFSLKIIQETDDWWIRWCEWSRQNTRLVLFVCVGDRYRHHAGSHKGIKIIKLSQDSQLINSLKHKSVHAWCSFITHAMVARRYYTTWAWYVRTLCTWCYCLYSVIQLWSIISNIAHRETLPRTWDRCSLVPRVLDRPSMFDRVAEVLACRHVIKFAS